MKSPVLTSLSPNTEADDIALAANLLFKRGNPKHLRSVVEQLQNIFSPGSVALVSSGREAIAQILKANDIGQDHEVIVQAFTCLAVPSAVKWAGATPIYIDIEADGYNIDAKQLEKAITPKTKAIIVQHSFGIPADIEEIVRIAKSNNLLVIEDLAHSLGQELSGKLLGTFGDAAILSFGRDKILSSVFGGAVISNDTELINKINSKEKVKDGAPATWVAQQLLHPIVMSMVKPLYFLGGRYILHSIMKLNFLSKAVTPAERLGNKPSFVSWQYHPKLAALVELQLDKLQRYNQRRREVVGRYAAELGTTPRALLRVPLKVKNRDQVLARAKLEKIILGDWYSTPVTPCSLDDCTEIADYIAGSCPVAENASRSVINLPTYPTMTDEQVEQVISFVKKHVS